MCKQAMKGSPAKGLGAQNSPRLGQGPRERPSRCLRAGGRGQPGRLLRAPAPSHQGPEGDRAGDSSSVEPGGLGVWWAWPAENAAASTYPTCHRLLQRAWGGHLRGRRHLEQAGHRPGRRPRPNLPPRAGPGPGSHPSDLQVRGVAAAVREAQRHLWGQG